MGKIGDAVSELHKLDMESGQSGWLRELHPLPKLAVTLFFLVLTVSFGKYDMPGLLKMGVYLIVLFVLGDVSLKLLLKRMRAVLVFVCLMGAVNPFFDRTAAFTLGNFAVTGGMLSAATLALKGIYGVSAAYLLIVTTSMGDICYALRRIHVPRMFVTILMLVYRYIIVLLKETERMTDAYALRAPGQRGIARKTWGTFAGQLLLRSMDRAQTVYDSMVLRGYNGNFHLRHKKAAGHSDYAYAFVWGAVLVFIRVI